MQRDKISEAYDGDVGTRRTQEVARERIHWLCRQTTGEDVLDVGCSQGIASILLAREGKNVVGIDRDPSLVEFAVGAREAELPSTQKVLKFLVADARQLPFPDEAFDTVLIGEMLEHQLDLESILVETRRVARPNGRVAITTPYGLFRYPDHKDSLYLGPLLDLLEGKMRVDDVVLIDRYLGITATTLSPRRSSDRRPGLWRHALTRAEQRLARQDEALEAVHRSLSRSTEENRALRAAYAEQEKLVASYERATEAASELERRLEAADTRRDAALSDLASARERVASSKAERDQLRREFARQSKLVSTLQARVRELGDRERELAQELTVRQAEALRGEAMLEGEHDELERELGAAGADVDALRLVERELRERLREAVVNAAAFEAERNVALRELTRFTGPVRDEADGDESPTDPST